MTCLLPSLDYVVTVLLTAIFFADIWRGRGHPQDAGQKGDAKDTWEGQGEGGGTREQRLRFKVVVAEVKIVYLYVGNQETCLATGCYYFWSSAKILVILVINCGTTCLCCIYATHNWRNCQSWGHLKTNCSARRVLYISISNTRQHITVLYCIIIFVIFTID